MKRDYRSTDKGERVRRNAKLERIVPREDGRRFTILALTADVERAGQRVVDLIERTGYAEALWVAEQIGFEYGVMWNPKKVQLHISLTDLQLIAFASALRAHVKAWYPASKERKRRSAKKTKG